MLLVGSRALIAHGVKIARKPSDTDVICTSQELKDWYAAREDDGYSLEYPQLESMGRNKVGGVPKKVVAFKRGLRPIEFEIAEASPTSAWLLENYESLGYPRVETEFGNAAHPDVVLTLKMSHRYLKNSPFFRKTMDDILALRGLKYRVPPALSQWLKDREGETYWYKHPSLKRDKAKFFSGDGVQYKYEHDDIHEALATLPKPCAPQLRDPNDPKRYPAYKYFQRDERVDVSVSKEKWDKILPEHERVKLLSVLEESYVLALERSQIPNDFSVPPRTSFLIALEKVCTSITSGWWREYAWENYYRVLGMYSDDYVDRFLDALHRGKIRDYMGEQRESA